MGETAAAAPGQRATQRIESEDGDAALVRFEYFAPWNWVLAARSTESELFADLATSEEAHSAALSHMLWIGGPILFLVLGLSILVAILSARHTVQNVQRQSQKTEAASQALGAISIETAKDTGRMVEACAQARTQMQGLAERMGNVHGSTTRALEQLVDAEQMAESVDGSVAEIDSLASETAAALVQMRADFEQTKDLMDQLRAGAENIAGILELVRGVARQTDLLAINASVEAARAGDAGRGFGVVATEVKKLALKTTEATEDIAERITGMQGTLARTFEVSETLESRVHRSETLGGNIAEQMRNQRESSERLRSQTNNASQESNTAGQQVEFAHELIRELGTLVDDLNQLAGTGAERAEKGRALAEDLAYRERT